MPKKSILILDDEKDIHYIFERLLQDEHELLHAYSVEEAIEQSYHKKKLDLIITDVFLGKETGFELVNTVRDGSDMPIIIISAYADAFTNDLIKGIKQTFECHFVKKPFDNDKMLELVNNLIG